MKKKLFAMTSGGAGHKPRGKNYTVTWAVIEIRPDGGRRKVESGFPNSQQARQRVDMLNRLSTHQYTSEQEN